MSVLRRRLPVLAGAATLLASTLAGCAVQVPDEVNAQWALIDPAGVNASSTSLELGVMGLACASGKTGDVTATHVEFADGQIAIGIAGIFLRQHGEGVGTTLAAEGQRGAVSAGLGGA